MATDTSWVIVIAMRAVPGHQAEGSRMEQTGRFLFPCCTNLPNQNVLWSAGYDKAQRLVWGMRAHCWGRELECEDFELAATLDSCCRCAFSATRG